MTTHSNASQQMTNLAIINATMDAASAQVAGSRALGLAQMQAVVDFFRANPDYPMPDRVTLARHRTEQEEADEALRVQAVVRWAESHADDGARLNESYGRVTCHVTLMARQGNTFSVGYLYEADLDREAAPRYVR